MAYDNDVYALHIGIKLEKTKINGHKFFSHVGNEQIPDNITNAFTDNVFFLALALRKEGNYTLALNTRRRFNLWQTSGQNSKLYFACQGSSSLIPTETQLQTSNNSEG